MTIETNEKLDIPSTTPSAQASAPTCTEFCTPSGHARQCPVFAAQFTTEAQEGAQDSKTSSGPTSSGKRKSLMPKRDGKPGGAKRRKTETQVDGKTGPAPKRTRVVPPRVDAVLAASESMVPKPWQTEPVSKFNFTITNMGKVENRNWQDWDRTGEPGDPIAFPLVVSVRDTPSNMKLVTVIRQLVASGRTAKAFVVTERSHGSYGKCAKNVELWFGRIVEEDQKFVAEFEERKRREEEEVRAKAVKRERARRIEEFVQGPEFAKAAFPVESVEQMMSEAQLKLWRAHELEVRKKALQEFVKWLSFQRAA